VLQFFRSFGMGAPALSLIGGVMAIAVYVLTAPFAGDWRLYSLQCLVVIPGYVGAIVGGLAATSKGADAIVATGSSQESRNKIAANPMVPVTPDKGGQ
jgi:hypothetical protein